MKKYIKILFISIVTIISALCLFACTPDPIIQNSGIVLPGVIEGDAGDYVAPPTTAYGQEPDLDNVVIDGKLDDELWQNKNWYTQYQSLNPTFKFEVATAFSDKGLYLAAKSNDRYVYWLDRNKFWGNTHMTFRFISNDEGGMTRQFNIDANNTGPTGNILNVRSTYKGEINNPGKSEGLFVEAFLTWEQLGYESKPSKVSLIPIYRYKMSRGENVRSLYNTFIVSDNADNAAPVFNTNGYTDVDKAGVTVGTHNTGLNKTTGWKVETDENGKETATVDCAIGGHTPKNFTQAIFFKDAPIATRFMIKARLTVNSNVGFTRAGLLMFKDRLNYRTYGVEIGNNFNTSKKEFSSITLKGWTNFPSDIVTPTTFGSFDVDTSNGRAKNQVDLTAFNNNGRIYYLLNNEFVYSETVNYAAGNCFIGLYAYNASVTFSDYEYKIYNTDEELRSDIKDYIYTVDVFNVNTTLATVELSQIAAPNDGTGSVEVIATYNQPRYDSKNQVYIQSVLDSASYSYVDEDGVLQTEDITEIAKENSKSGRFTIENIPGNIQIQFQAKEVVLEEYVTLEFQLKNEQSRQPISTAAVELYSYDEKYSNYIVRLNRGDGHASVVVPKGCSWNVELESAGYRPYKGVLAGGAKVNESQDPNNAEVVLVTATVVGGNALNSKGDVIAGSAPGVYWDMADEANSKVTFTSTNTGSSYVYFSGDTVSDYQVAYVEITNQTDYTAFRSIEDDPGVGFVITGEKSGVSSRALLWKTGVRIINNPNLGWAEGVKSIGGFCNFPGHTAIIDRNNGGAVAGEPVLGSGTVNRVPYGDKTYTTSFLMIRRGGNTFLYAADGRAGVKKDKTNFSKMQLLYSYYNPLNTDAAAIGFAITVSFNLRIDFENYWLLNGDDAAAFADRVIKTDISVQGSEYVDVESGGMFEYNENTGKGKIALASNVVLSYKDSLGDFPKGKLLKITMPDGSFRLIGSKGESCAFDITSISSTKWKVKAEMVDAATVKGRLVAPYEGFNIAGVKGAILNEAGEEVATFITSPEGEYKAVVEAGKKYMARVYVAGQASTQPLFEASEGYQIPDLTLTALGIGAAGTAGAVTYGMNDALGGIYALYKTPNAANGAINFKSEPKQNFVLEYSFFRNAAPEGSTSQDETDLGIGMRISDGSDTVELMNMGDGYRILTNKSVWATRMEQRGKGGANVQSTTISSNNYITIKFVKVGGVIYMYNKYASDANFRLINTWTIASNANDPTPICTGAVSVGIWWTSTAGRYLDLTFFNISLKDVNAETAPEIFGELNVTAPASGSISVADANGNTLSNGTKLTGGALVTITVNPPAGQRVKNLYINGTAVVLSGYKGGVLTYKHTVAGDVNVRADFEVAMRDVTLTLSGLAIDLGVDTVEVYVNGALYKEMDTSSRATAFDDDTALKSGNTLKVRLPEGVVTIKLYKDGELVQEFKDFDVTKA